MDSTKDEEPIVLLKWRDYVDSLEKLASVTTINRRQLDEYERQLDIFFHGCDSIAYSRQISGKVLGMDVKLENIGQKVVSKYRYLQRTVDLLVTFMEYSVFTSNKRLNVVECSANCTIQLFHKFCTVNWSEIPLSSIANVDRMDMNCLLWCYFHTNVMDRLQRIVGNGANTSLSDYFKLQLCVIIQKLEDFEKFTLALLESNIFSSALQESVKNATLSRRQQSTVIGRLVYLLQFSKITQDDLFQLIGKFTDAQLLNCALDLVLVCRVSDLPYSELISQIVSLSSNYFLNNPELMCQLFQVTTISICSKETANIEEVAQLLNELLVQVSVEVGTLVDCNSACNVSEIKSLHSCYGSCLELLAKCYESDIDTKTFTCTLLKTYVQTCKLFLSLNEKEQLFSHIVEFASVSVTKYHAMKYLTEGFNSFLNFFKNCLGFQQLTPQFPLLCKNIDLGTLFVHQQIQPESLVDFFEHSLPRSFYEFSQWMISDQEKMLLIHSIQEMGYRAVRNGLNRFKAFIFYLPSIYTRISNNYELTPQDQAEILSRVLSIAMSGIEKHNDISLLLSSGIPIVLDLFSSKDDICRQILSSIENIHKKYSVMEHLEERFEYSSYSTLLFLKYDYEFCKANFSAEQTRHLFKNLTKKARRDEVKLLNRICKTEFLDSKYDKLRDILLNTQPQGKGLSSREFESLCRILGQIVSICSQKLHTIIDKITLNIIRRLEKNLEANESGTGKNGDKAKREGEYMSKKQFKQYEDELSRVMLFSTLFQDQLDMMEEKNEQEISWIFQNKFPEEVVQDERTMNILGNLAKRLQHMEPVKYAHVKKMALDCINVFMSPEHSVDGENAKKIRYRAEQANKYILELPQNVAIIEGLVELGYHPSLWSRGSLYVQVQVNDRQNLEENYRSSLVQCYEEYLDLLKELAVKNVAIASQQIPLETLFANGLSIEQLKERRMAAIKVLDTHTNNHPRASYIFHRKLTLLQKEEELSATYQQQKRVQSEVSNKKTYWAKINNNFMDILNTCNNSIVGCYAPEGDHCEKPIEIALKANQAIISVYEEPTGNNSFTLGNEIENVEVLFCDQGMLVYKLYTNGHPWDTSIVWACVFKSIIQANLVPAIIVPKGFPNESTFALLSQCIEAEYSSSTILCRDNLFANVESYYDFKPEKINVGDIVITEAIVNQITLPDLQYDDMIQEQSIALKTSTEMARTIEHRSVHKKVSKPVKDLTGTIVAEVMSTMYSKPLFSVVKVDAFGKHISRYVQKILELGHADESILVLGFDLDQWNRRKATNCKITPQEKSEMVSTIVHDVKSTFEKYYHCDVGNLYDHNKIHFFELKTHMELVSSNEKTRRFQSQLGQMKQVLAQRASMCMIADFQQRSQEEIIRWIFKNEDKVWMNRGGRPGEETVAAFINFVTPPLKTVAGEDDLNDFGYSKTHYGHDACGGIVVLNDCVIEGNKDRALNLQRNEIIAYCVGDFNSPNSYEIVTAWVDPRYKGMEIAMKLYIRMMIEARKSKCKYLECDLIYGALGKIITCSTLFSILTWMGLDKYIIMVKRHSYATKTLSGSEQFEKLVIRIGTLVPFLRLYKNLCRIGLSFSRNVDSHYFDFLGGPLRNPSNVSSIKWKLSTKILGVGIGIGIVGIFLHKFIK